MKEVLRSNNAADLTFAKALLSGEGIQVFEMDVNMSVLEGSIGAFPRRLMVRTDDHPLAARALRDNGLDPSP